MTSVLKLVQPGVTSVGFIGLGVMGASMAGHILKSGYNLTVFNRSAFKCEPLRQQGAHVANSPMEVANVSDVIITMVGYPADVEQVLLGKDGVVNGVRPGSIVVDMTTSKPALAEDLHARFLAKDVYMLSAPVSGGSMGAANGTLSIMAGGDKVAFDAVLPLFQCFGKNIRLLGGASAGQHCKMTNQILIASGMVALVEGLLYAYKAGLDLDETIAAVSTGAAGSWSLSNYGPRILKRNFDPGFYVHHFIKDMQIALSECERMQLVLPGLTQAKMLYDILAVQGHANLGTHSLILALEKLNNCEMKSVSQ